MEKANYQSRPYGYMVEKASNFIFVAPHAAGDDAFTRYITYALAQELQASAVINTQYFKETNKKAKRYPERVCNFNRLTWWQKGGKHLFQNKHPDLKAFYKDIFALQKKVRESDLGRAIIVHIHGMQNQDSCIDIGMGAWYNSHIRAFEDSANVKENNGEVTMPPEMAILLRKKLEHTFKAVSDKEVTIGRYFPAWSRWTGIQTHKTINKADWAFQLEIDKSLRTDKEHAKRTGALIAQSLKTLL
ncbi:hypothetical protein H6758_03000 [Candidatus Nomurabacteria bacterium]|nr:hypothetical protein [Candidatus Nomurabacteria bacterium]